MALNLGHRNGCRNRLCDTGCIRRARLRDLFDNGKRLRFCCWSPLRLAGFTERRWHRCHWSRRQRWQSQSRQITHNIAQRGRRSRLNTGARTGQNVVGWTRICGRIALRHRKSRLQRPDRLVKCQSLRLQDLRCRAFSITYDGRQNNSAVDIAPPAATRCSGRGFKNTSDSRRYSQGPARLLRFETSKITERFRS